MGRRQVAMLPGSVFWSLSPIFTHKRPQACKQRVSSLWWSLSMASELQYYLFSLLESFLSGAHDDTAARGMLSDSCGGTCSETTFDPLKIRL